MGALPPSTRRSVLLAAAAGVVVPTLSQRAAAASSSGEGGVVDLPLTGSADLRGDAAVLRTGRLAVPSFALLGVSWQGPGRPQVRVRSRRQGVWSGWEPLSVLPDAPDRGTEGRAGLHSTAPRWSGPADGVDVELRGSGVRAPVLHLVDPGTAPADARRHHHGHHEGHHHGHHGHHGHPKTAPEPAILPRAAWGANERWRNGGPYYNHTIKQVHVHHTATGNHYGADDVPALLRGIYRYHTHANGWSDIAYNFLVDKFGRVWEGRFGGVDRPVRGAHTLGFNSTSTGIAVIGNYDREQPKQMVITALAQVAAWKLDGYGRVPDGWTHVRSQGSDRYAAGQRVALPVIDGHRDTNDTDCPGELLYDLLGHLRGRAQKRADRYNPHDGR